MELFAYFNNKLIEALVKCTKNSLDLLKQKATMIRYYNTHIFIYAYIYLLILYLYYFMVLY